VSTARLANWNVAWASPRSPRGPSVATKLESLAADVICLTEGVEGVLPEGGHLIDSDPDYGYPIRPGRRKVLLWSRRPWSDVDRVGDPTLPTGRFVAGVTDTPIGPLRVVGVCIPWSMAHVANGRRDRAPWEDHLTYPAGLGSLLSGPSERPVLVAGDFNQRIPAGGRTPRRIGDRLAETFAAFDLVTAGSIEGVDAPLIDHVALGEGLVARRVWAWPKTLDGVDLSDHAGVCVELGHTQSAA
jgi:endonuclease/exonuclease/phosphatase family metal-dependent hydrolase